ncbi:hypothetical protein EG329_004892 [Mollisiaceae sp. DMI_Dod_QoI]|nr:hypothetical protein EG329_004892 [Helotiales sp. DMI_Dod_QoI]
MPVLPSPAPSDESSPIISHTPVNGSQTEGRRNGYREEPRQSSSTTLTPSTQAPRLSSSETNTQIPRENPSIDLQHRSSTSSNPSYNQSNWPFTSPTEPVESQPPSTMSDNIPPLPSSVLLPSDRQQGEQSLAHTQVPPVAQQTSPVLSRDPAQTQSLPARPSPIQSLSRGQQTSRPQNSPQEFLSRQSQQGQLPSPVQTNPSPRLDPGAVFPPVIPPSDARSYPTSGTIPANPRKRQRIQPASMPSLRGRVSLIEAHIQRAGGQLNLNTGLERPRFQLLTDACNQEDAFYVALHQIFCCWDTDRNQVLSIQGYPPFQVLQMAVKILGQLIRDNDALAPNHKRWFSEFPSPLRDLLQSSEPYRRIVGEVGNFLTRLASDWGALSLECTNRGYPPLVDELVNRMGLLSPILQSVVFTASRRNLGIRDEEIGTQMEDLFKKDQRGHQALAARYNTARPPTAREAQERNRALATEYINLHNQLIQHRHSSAMVGSASRVPTPTVPNSGYYQPSAADSPPIPRPQVVNQGHWNQNMPNPDAAGNRQFPNSIPPRMQRTVDGSPNLATVGTRPPSAGAQHVYTNTPSPTLLQGLSMQSPIQQNFPSPPVLRSNVSLQPQQNGSSQIGGQTNGTYYHPTLSQQIDPATQPRAQVLPQQQQGASQLQQNPANQLAQSHLFQQQQAAVQQAAQQRQIQQELSRQVLMMNRATHRETNPVYDNQQQNPLRINNVINGHRPQSFHNMVGTAPGQLSSASQRQPSVQSEQQAADIFAYNQKPSLHRSLVPPLHYVHPQQPTNPDVTALHQAHLRSPRLVAADIPPSSMSQEIPALRYYQAVRGFVLSPTRISSSSPLSKFDFTVPPSDLILTPKDIVHGNGQVATREFRKGTLQYRLRCVQAKRTDTKCAIADWVVSDTVWPESASLAINRTQLDIRRKNHHGKDLPIDITPFVKSSAPNSTNQVTLSIIKGRSKMKEFGYFLAVEVIEILHHSQILEMCYQSRIPANQTLNKIKKSLAGPTGSDDDDDIAMVVSDLSIDLADPFTAKIFETPVRGSSCLHRECFDLETFLLTRNSKPKRPEQPCMVDVWKCPLCGKDARPYSLQIDDFLGSVRAALQEQGNLDVKAILIGADGRWRPKVEKRKATAGPDDSDYSSDGDGASRRGVSASSKQPVHKKVVEVIDLDD